MEKLKSLLKQYMKNGLYPLVRHAPAGAVTFDCMILIYTDSEYKRLMQIHFYNTKDSEIKATF